MTARAASRLTQKSIPGRADLFIPMRRACSAERQLQLRTYLLTIALALTKKAQLATLADWLDKNPVVLSEWLHWGEVPPYPAAHITKAYELRRRAMKRPPREITLKDLSPSLFLPE